MAEASMRLLGLAPAAGLEALRAALAAVPGPAIALRADPACGAAALLQPEPAAALTGRGRAGLLAGLRSLQRRLEVACLAGPFLPADPSAACCPAAALDGALAAAWPAAAAALARCGGWRQWDLALRWTPESALARHRDALAGVAGREALAAAVAATLARDRAERAQALADALRPAVLAMTPASGGETEVALTVLAPPGDESGIEAALGRLPERHGDGASLDMRGPMPPLSFAAARLLRVDAAQLGQAWRLLHLPERADAALMRRHWRGFAFTLHPDRNPAPDAAQALAELGAAHRLLRAAMAGPPPGDDGAPHEGWTLARLARRAGWRLAVPDGIDLAAGLGAAVGGCAAASA